MSDDGQCVIEIMSPKPSDTDVASRLDISRAAEEVMEKCVDDPDGPAVGGWIKNIGIQDFSPRKILHIQTSNPASADTIKINHR